VDAAPLLRLGYELVLPWFSLMPYAQGTLGAPLTTARLNFSTTELGVGVLVSRALDFRWLTVRGGLAVEALRLAQSEAAAKERSRESWGAVFAGQLALESPPLIADLFVAASAEAAVYVYRSTSAALEPTGAGELSTRPALRGLLSVGYEF
jgi:hypothetical protein